MITANKIELAKSLVPVEQTNAQIAEEMVKEVTSKSVLIALALAEFKMIELQEQNVLAAYTPDYGIKLQVRSQAESQILAFDNSQSTNKPELSLPKLIFEEDKRELETWLSYKSQSDKLTRNGMIDNVAFLAADAHNKVKLGAYFERRLVNDQNENQIKESHVSLYNRLIDEFFLGEKLGECRESSVGKCLFDLYPPNNPNKPRANFLVEAKVLSNEQALNFFCEGRSFQVLTPRQVEQIFKDKIKILVEQNLQEDFLIFISLMKMIKNKPIIYLDYLKKNYPISRKKNVWLEVFFNSVKFESLAKS